MEKSNLKHSIDAAAQYISNADSLIITAGAGIGVDSGLPDFRGNVGFWQAYPALQQAGLNFHDIANPASFRQRPEHAWGFYGHRLALYRETTPHKGFEQLQTLAANKAAGAFVITSNVDGQFQKAGFASQRIWEIHGSIHHLQCLTPCCQRFWSASALHPRINEKQCLWVSGQLPTCPYCGGLARPNILMFNDWHFVDVRTTLQQGNFNSWRKKVSNPVVIEIGAGKDLPSIRRLSERMGCPIIRINPTAADIPLSHQGISLPLSAKMALNLLVESIS
ncbi:NAD-dependent deacetylase [Leeia sp. TBRC 13508]|uniref:protein acetyllysine N-acetyltransferase n=1 Tax=Leeia speluncae TaxID=2884804 RepID=A0ABS8D3Q0_9NEIS|nr:Sir2 family NAD-dependent protein deacetylase [Leeia speluncae]MCB6182653.1 NAD-dependent deacetylase [Leeia speluncae]